MPAVPAIRAAEVKPWLLFDIGCAECRFGAEPLVSVRRFDSREAAEALVTDEWGRLPSWHDHPQGGRFVTRSTGEMWLVHVDELHELPE